jgi:hypothetical protein
MNGRIFNVFLTFSLSGWCRYYYLADSITLLGGTSLFPERIRSMAKLPVNKAGREER